MLDAQSFWKRKQNPQIIATANKRILQNIAVRLVYSIIYLELLFDRLHYNANNLLKKGGE